MTSYEAFTADAAELKAITWEAVSMLEVRALCGRSQNMLPAASAFGPCMALPSMPALTSPAPRLLPDAQVVLDERHPWQRAALAKAHTALCDLSARCARHALATLVAGFQMPSWTPSVRCFAPCPLPATAAHAALSHSFRLRPPCCPRYRLLLAGAGGLRGVDALINHVSFLHPQARSLGLGSVRQLGCGACAVHQETTTCWLPLGHRLALCVALWLTTVFRCTPVLCSTRRWRTSRVAWSTCRLRSRCAWVAEVCNCC